MTPIARDYLDGARGDLKDARKILGIGLPKAAARSAYFAAFHAAEALIFEKMGKAVKTHSGVHSEFARILRGFPDARKPLLCFLSQAYRYKTVSDHVVETDATVTNEDAEMAVAEAARFLDQIAAWLMV